MKKIEVEGHSGCNIEIQKHEEGLVIDKYTKDKKYIPRLKAQLLKQEKYSFMINTDKIIVPKVFSIDDSWTDECHGIMEYVYGKNFVAFFEYADKMIVDDFINTIIKYVNEEIKKSEMVTEYTTDELYYKWQSVKTNMLNIYSSDDSVKYLEDITNIIEKCDKIFVPNMTFKNFPIGICHGDLTFSNIIFRTNEYALIDFLDSFIESPIMDIVKLRQDTKYMWSTLMYNSSRDYDESRYKIICEYIDKKLNNYFSKWFHFYNESYNVFQLMNFLRIVQYAKSDKVTEYLINVINNILEIM